MSLWWALQVAAYEHPALSKGYLLSKGMHGESLSALIIILLGNSAMMLDDFTPLQILSMFCIYNLKQELGGCGVERMQLPAFHTCVGVGEDLRMVSGKRLASSSRLFLEVNRFRNLCKVLLHQHYTN